MSGKLILMGALGISFIGIFFANIPKAYAASQNFQGKCTGSHHIWGSFPINSSFPDQKCVVSVGRISKDKVFFVFRLSQDNPSLPPIGFLTSNPTEGKFSVLALSWGEAMRKVEGGFCLRVKNNNLRCTATTTNKTTIQLTLSPSQ